MDKELVDSSNYFFEPWLNTYVFNEKNPYISGPTEFKSVLFSGPLYSGPI